MARFVLEFFVAAPPERVFDLARDLETRNMALKQEAESDSPPTRSLR